MLMKCPECELQVSDKASCCPHCGYPISTPEKKVRGPAKKKHLRLPNGFGTITKLSNPNLRNPYRAMVCVGKSPIGKPIYKALKPQSTFKTYNDAYSALVEYNKNPYDLNLDMTVDQLYEKWTDEFVDKWSDGYYRGIKSAWAYCSSIYNMRVKDVRARHIKGCMEEGYRIEYRGKNKGQKVFASPGTKERIKSLFNTMLDYAEEYEIVDKNYARTFEVSDDIFKEIEDNKKAHIPFTEDELGILWDNVDRVEFCDWIIIQCYMGWRPQELAKLRLDEININDWYMCAGMKTDAGRQRIVPIHSRIRALVLKNIAFAKSIDSEFLFNSRGQTHAGSWALTYDKYANRFRKVIDALKLNPDHKPHDPRMTFITRGKKANMDEYALKEMVGHNVKDITESTYTLRDLEWLRSDLEKLK